MGVGQAMMEQTVYDDGGQLVSASFMDYAMPRAHDLPMFKDDVHVVPATTNPLGVKGAGEAGTTAAIAAVMNAFADAIPGAGAQDPDAGNAGEGVEGVPGDGGLSWIAAVSAWRPAPFGGSGASPRISFGRRALSAQSRHRVVVFLLEWRHALLSAFAACWARASLLRRAPEPVPNWRSRTRQNCQ